MTQPPPQLLTMCPVCGELVTELKDARIDFMLQMLRTKEPPVPMRMLVSLCESCAPYFERVVEEAHRRAGISFDPQLVQCLRAATINGEADRVKAAVDEFIRIANDPN